MQSIGLHLEPHVRENRLRFHTARPTVQGLEMHQVVMHKMIEEFQPAVVILDPVSNLHTAGTGGESASMFVRLVDFLRKKTSRAIG